MAIVLALGAALSFGVGDFLGGNSAKRMPALQTAATAQFFGLFPLVIGLVVIPGTAAGADIGWGLAAGAAGGIGMPLLFAALAAGPMNVVAPLSAVTSAAVPVLVGTILGERPGPLAWTGIALAIAAALAISTTATPTTTEKSTTGTPECRRTGRPLRGIVLAVAAGVCFGGFFSLLGQAGDHGGVWPVLAARVGGFAVAALLLLVSIAAGSRLRDRFGANSSPQSGAKSSAESGTSPAAVWRQAAPKASPGISATQRAGIWLAIVSGCVDSIANVLFLAASQLGYLSVTGALIALYPAVTVFLARVLHAERTSTLQRIGLAVAATSVILISVGA